jgi:pimeloyl-ACP methyl ester carboxylesterase
MPGVRNETCVLVHGAWHGPWSWDEVLTRLRERGCAALAVDLTAAAQSLESLSAELGRQLGPGSSRVVLVGHSRAGPVISQVAEHWPERVAGLVYVSGFLLENGESALRALRGDGTSPLLRDAALTPDGRHWVVAETDAKRIFYGRCAECLQDVAVPLSLQRRMQAALPCERVVTLDADHSPFFSAPAALAEILREEVERF